jgi:hypothetical protein
VAGLLLLACLLACFLISLDGYMRMCAFVFLVVVVVVDGFVDVRM